MLSTQTVNNFAHIPPSHFIQVVNHQFYLQPRHFPQNAHIPLYWIPPLESKKNLFVFEKA
jgi:hypothetical protein